MRRLVLYAVCLCLPVVARATVLIPIEFRELVAAAPVIVHGRVMDVRSAWIEGRRSVETFVTIQAAEYLKGNLGESVTIRVPGGEMGRYRTVFVGAPTFLAGDEVVLFLKTSTRSLPTIVGLNQGAFRVVADTRSGSLMVTSPILMGLTGGDAAPVVRGDVRRRPLAIDAFRDAVRQVLAGSAQ